MVVLAGDANLTTPLLRQMKKVLLSLSALLLSAPTAVAQLVDVTDTKLISDWTEARTIPELDGQWSVAPNLPFSPTKAGFSSYLKSRYGFTVLSLEGCRGTKSRPIVKPSSGSLKYYFLGSSKRYQCDQVFYQQSDPRGTQRCMGTNYFVQSWGAGPGLTSGKWEPEQIIHGGKTLKNDCRWL